MSSGAQAQGLESPSKGGQEKPTQTFEPAGKYALNIDGEAVPEATIYISLSAGSSLLLKAPQLSSPLLLRPQAKSLDRVQPADLQPRDDGTIDISPGAELKPAGTYTIEGTTLLLSVGERQMRLVDRHLFGLHDAATLTAWDPEYGRRARRYSPSSEPVETLSEVGAVRIRAYFGSWCPRCRQAIPRLMRLAEELEGSGLRFEFFGMPQHEEDAPESFWGEAKAAGAYDDEVNIVPLVVVFRGDQRIGRITTGWGNPARELEKILVNGSGD